MPKLIRNTKTPGISRPLTIEELNVFPFLCANCSSAIQEATVYCSQVCAQSAEWVRYSRRCRVDGRDERADVIEALRIRLALVLGGGYDKITRKLPDSVRKAITERDQGLGKGAMPQTACDRETASSAVRF